MERTRALIHALMTVDEPFDRARVRYELDSHLKALHRDARRFRRIPREVLRQLQAA